MEYLQQSCHRYFLFRLQVIKASIRKSVSPNIERLWNDFTKMPLFLCAHTSGEWRTCEHCTQLRTELLTQKTTQLRRIAKGSTVFMRLYCLCIQTLPSFYYFFFKSKVAALLQYDTSKIGPQRSLPSRFLLPVAWCSEATRTMQK